MKPLEEQGDVKAQYFLSVMYKIGDVVTQDFIGLPKQQSKVMQKRNTI